MNEHKGLFEDFSPVTAKAWKQKIQFDLKGGDYQELITHTLEGIDIKPFYHSDDFERLDFDAGKHNFEGVLVLERIPSEPETMEILKGVEKIRIRAAIEKIPDYLWQNENIILEPGVYFLPEPPSFSFKATVSVNPLTHLALRGIWQKDEKTDWRLFSQWLNAEETVYAEADASIYQNAGANIVQQLAYTLSQILYLKKKFGDEITGRIRVKWAVGYHYFFEIAKFKAFRYLFSLLTGDKEAGKRIVLYAQPSFRNKTRPDAYVNMLRSGMEVMAAVLGGVDQAGNFAYDFIYNDNNPAAERWARNQLAILREEALLGRLDMVEGAYYPETVAVQLAGKALDLIKQLEAGGGYVKKLYDGTIQRKIAQMAEKEQALFDEGKLVLTGTNKYPSDEMKLPGEKRRLNPVKKGEKTIIRPIVLKRLSERLERQWKKRERTLK